MPNQNKRDNKAREQITELQAARTAAGGIPVRCNRCKWEGKLDDLVVVYALNPKQLGDVTPETGCPACLAHEYLEFKED